MYVCVSEGRVGEGRGFVGQVLIRKWAFLEEKSLSHDGRS